DAGITAVYATQFKRTQQTAAPLAEALGLTPVIVNSSDTAGLVMRLSAAGGHVLVVGHSNTVIEIARALGIDTAIIVGDNEYDNLFIVVRGSPARLIRLRY
ncbi:MAG: histidine phosphatase family protein, partial [Acidobacteriota bacterium]